MEGLFGFDILFIEFVFVKKGVKYFIMMFLFVELDLF